jgi:hypothetical protein
VAQGVKISREYQRVGDALAEQIFEVDLQPMVDMVAVNAEIFSDQIMPEAICEYPEDDKFISP